jgi:hypothetical protein
LEQRATVFVEAMVVVAIIGVLAFLIALLVRSAQRPQTAGSSSGEPAAQSPRWYEFTLALLLLAAIAAFAIWLISSGRQWAWGETFEDWRSDTRAIVFAAIMVALGVIGLVVSFAYTLAQSTRSAVAPRPIDAAAAEKAPASAPVASVPAAPRLLGLLGLVVAVVLLCWIALAPADQHGLIVQLVYPASLGVALVLLFDKATRAWGEKGTVETVREWLLCDLLMFLLLLAFLNLRSLAKPEAYASSFWDILNLVLFFAAFWVIDRTASRSRFLIGYGYLVLLPLLFVIWTTTQGVAAPASSWASMWPFLILAVVFFILEVVTLVSSTGQRQVLPALKDAVFVVIYLVLLIVALKSSA